MKYWSCCQRKTTEFQHFLDQVGCSIGKHKWVDDKGKGWLYEVLVLNQECYSGKEISCRYDWHQTATHVTVAVYAKNYDHRSVKLQVSPVRLNFTTYFPQEAGSFDMDVELKGVRPSFAMLL